MVLYQVGSSDMRRSKLASVNVSAKVSRNAGASLRLNFESDGSRDSSCLVEFRTKYQEKKIQIARQIRFRTAKRLKERYPPFVIRLVSAPCAAAPPAHT